MSPLYHNVRFCQAVPPAASDCSVPPVYDLSEDNQKQAKCTLAVPPFAFFFVLICQVADGRQTSRSYVVLWALVPLRPL